MIRIERYQPELYESVNEYLKGNSKSTPFHTVEWYELINKVYHHRNETLIAIQNDKVCGILPLSLISITFGKKYLASGPFSSHCEILYENSQIKNELLLAAVDLSKKLGVQYLEIKSFEEFEKSTSGFDDNLKNKLITNRSFCTMELFCAKEDDLWKNFSKTLRNTIRKAIKNKLEVSNDNNKLIPFYELLSKTMKRHGTPIHSIEFYDEIITKLGGAEIINIELNGKVIATNLLIGFNNTLHSLASASDKEYWNFRPNEYLWWECIKYALENNYEYLDFGRSKIEQGTYLFKSKFGAKPKNLNYLYYLNNSDDMPDVSEDNFKFKIATSLWKILPLEITKKLGHYLIRYVS